MNLEQQLEDLYLSQSIIQDEITEVEYQIKISSPENIIKQDKEAIRSQSDFEEYKYIDTATNLDVYYYTKSDTLDKKYLEVYHYQTIYRGKEQIGYERIRIDKSIISASTEVSLKSIQIT